MAEAKTASVDKIELETCNEGYSTDYTSAKYDSASEHEDHGDWHCKYDTKPRPTARFLDSDYESELEPE